MGLAVVIAVVIAVGGMAVPVVPVMAQGDVQRSATSASPANHTRHEAHGFVLYIAGTVMRNADIGEIEYIVAEQVEFLGSADTPFWQITGMNTSTMIFISACRGVYGMLPRARDRWREGVAVAQLQSQSQSTSQTQSQSEPCLASTPTPTPTSSDDGNVVDVSVMEFSVGWLASDRQLVSSVGELTTEALNYHGTRQGLFTNDELLAMIYQAPSRQDTRSATSSPADKSFTDEELAYWIAEYHALGGLNDFEFEMLRSINEVRAYYDLHPFAISIEMSMAARLHSQEMADLRFFGHRSPNNGSSPHRGRMFGANVWGENLGGGGLNSSRVEMIVTSWLNSPGHRVMILHCQVTVIGIGTTLGGGTSIKFGISNELSPITRFSNEECISIRNPLTLGFCHFYGWVGESLIEARK